jgi:hypothetical protein
MWHYSGKEFRLASQEIRPSACFIWVFVQGRIAMIKFTLGPSSAMKKLFIIILFAVFAVGCLAPVRAEASTNVKSQAKSDRKLQKKQQKAMKKYMKAQRKAQKKMIKKDRKNTHLPSHY